ncbi:MAG: hypothetical protein Q8N99_06290 [Nanoarchaeota archaeon]|nr:hypothetical protein [Nanoarchaeota archaeon]
MKKGIPIYFTLIILFLITNVISYSDYKECKKECTGNRVIFEEKCNNQLSVCENELNEVISNCNTLEKTEKYNCLKIYRNSLSLCKNEKRECIRENTLFFSRCHLKCLYEKKNIACEDGKYKGGDFFLKDCNICECKFNGRTSCKPTSYCNFNNPNLKKQECESSNGLFQKLCAGSIYSSKCTTEFFCQCAGNLGFQCPENYSCLLDFQLNMNRRGQFAQDWVKLPKFIKMGNIGVCVKKPELLNCGNGICENICDSFDCSISETKYNCPDDCKV